MRARVQKWGNSLALRIPKAFAVEAQLQAESEVDLSLLNGKILVAPVPAPAYKLEDLLAKINKRNLHGEVDFGPARGKEQW